MSQWLFANDAEGTLASPIADSDTSITLASGQGAQFPAPGAGEVFDATLQTSSGREDVLVTAKASDTFTVTRAQEGTTAQAWAVGTKFRLHLRAGFMNAVGAFIANVALVALKALAPAADKIPYFTSGSAAGLLTRDTDGTLAGNSDTNIATQKAVKTYVDTQVASGGVVSSVFGRTGAVVKASGDYAVADVTGAAPLASPTFTGDPTGPTRTYGDNDTSLATTAFVQGALATRVDSGNSGTSKTLDWTQSNFILSTLTGNVTYTFTAPSPALGVLVLEVVQGSGPYTVTWPAAVHWPGGTAPTLSSTSGKKDIFTFYYIGSTYYGVTSGQNFTV